MMRDPAVLYLQARHIMNLHAARGNWRMVHAWSWVAVQIEANHPDLVIA